MTFENFQKNLKGAYVSIFAGAGGDDAKDWALMLLKMYKGYAERKGWKYNQINDLTLEIRGYESYEKLLNEAGVHRLVRISPFDAKKLRHTSFALVEVLPILPIITVSHFNIPENDLKIEFMRSSGPGGQNVNKVETAVRIVHIPTGLSTFSQIERSQNANKERAMEILKIKIIQLMKEKQETELKNLKIKVKPEWGNEIRSYVLHPYKQIKNHKTGEKKSCVEEVLKGNLDLLNSGVI